jgi:cell division protein FtsQ
LSDPEDVKVVTNNSDGEVLVHLGSSNYLDRFKIYVAHLREWRAQFAKLESVDLRYDRQIIVNPDLQGTARQPSLSPVAVKAAMAAGVKPALLVDRGPVKPSSTHAAVVKTAVSKHSVSPALPQRARKDGGSTVVPHKKPVKQSHWRKHASTTKHVVVNPVAKTVTVASKPRSAPVAQKPSPAIQKGQGSH